MRCFRLDYGALGAVERTPQGGIRVAATLTRSGVFEYQTIDGRTIREYRAPAEVARADSLSSLRGAPLTLDHPPSKIDATNYRQFSIGHVGDDVQMVKADVGATVYIQDAQAIRAIENGRRELSCGYHCDVDETPGVVPASDPVDAGKPYDRAQKSIHYNHLAFVDDGRAGNARLRLDSNGNALFEGATRMSETTKVEIVEGVEYPVGTDAHRAARERRDAADKGYKETIGKLTAERDAQAARADAAEAKLTAAQTFVKEKLTPERMDAAVAKRTAIVEKARAIMGKEWKADGKTNAAIRAEVVAKAYPGIRLDSKSADYVGGLWESLTSKDVKESAARNDATAKLLAETSPMPGAAGLPAGAPPRDSIAQIRHDAMVSNQSRAARPLALSRRERTKPLSSHPMLQGSQLEVMK